MGRLLPQPHAQRMMGFSGLLVATLPPYHGSRPTPDLPTRADLYELGVEDVIARSQARPPAQRISAEALTTQGSDINIFLSSVSAMAEEVLRQLAMRIAALYVDGASGSDLDRLVADRFSPLIVRKGATPALVTLVLTRTSGSLPAITLATGTVFQGPNGQQFETTAAAAVPSGSNGPVSVVARARVAGTAGNLAAGTITSFVSPPGDTALQVTNPEPAAGGDDTETDASLRARAKTFFRAVSKATKAAIEFGALTVPGVRQASSIEELDPSSGEPTGRVQLIIADANGQANAALVAAVQTALVEYRAEGIIVDIVSGVPTYVPIVLRPRFDAGVDTSAAWAQLVSVVVANVNSLVPGQTLAVSLITSAARSVPGVIVYDDFVDSPVGDIVALPTQVLRTTTALVTTVSDL